MTGQDLLNIVLREGVEVEENYNELIDEFDKALIDGNVHFIHNDGKEVGFLTYEEKDKRLLINKCVIYKPFRQRFSLLTLRKFFRSLYNGRQYYWHSRRRNRFCYVK